MTQYQHYDNTKNPNDEVATKPELWRPLSNAVGGFDLDPAAGAEETPIADTCYTVADDGLTRSWTGTVFLNPPFSEKQQWYRKAINERNCGNADLVIALAPVDTSTEWFHSWFVKADALCFLQGRDWYIQKSQGSQPSFNTAVGVFGEYPDELLSVLDSLGTVMQTNQFHTQRELQ